MRNEGLKPHISGFVGRGLRLMTSAAFETALLCLLLLTAAAIIWQNQILERTVRFTPATTASSSYLVFSDGDIGGKSFARYLGPMHLDCELRSGNAYPYCGFELFVDRNRGIHGLDLSHMHSLAITMMYRGASTSFRVHLKNFDPSYSHAADDESPKYLRVEADTTPGKLQRAEFVLDDFGVADWWLRKHKLAPEFGRPQFDNITSLIVETGSEAPMGRHDFEVREIEIRTAILSDAEWYSLLLGIWIVMIVTYLGYRISNLRHALRERRTLEALALRDAQDAARRDHLTGILNRRGVTERFDTLINERGATFSTAVIMIDIDHFKKLNDTHGHDYGDKVLSAFATVLSRNVRVVDMAARWGGEEFIVVCTDIDRRGAQRVADKIRQSIETFDFGPCGQVTASLGIYWSHVTQAELVPMVALADLALYSAKAGGRNCCKLHGAEMSDAA